MSVNSFGQRLAELREELGETQEAVGDRLGLTKGAMSQYENNRREPDFEMLKKLADLYQVSIDYLMGRTDNRALLLSSADGETPPDLERTILQLRARIDQRQLALDSRPLTEYEARMILAPLNALLAIVQTIRENHGPSSEYV